LIPEGRAMRNKIIIYICFIGLILFCRPFACPAEDAETPPAEDIIVNREDAVVSAGGEAIALNRARTLRAASGQQEISAPTQQNKITLDIKGMDIVDVLKMLSSRSGMNIAVGKNVTGRVTLFLKDVDIWDAFEIILLSNDLAFEEMGPIINVITQRDYELKYGERFQDNKQARVIKLKYAKAADLTRALTQIKSSVGKVVADEGSNTVALIDSAQKIRDMEDFIKKTDLPLETKIFSLDYAVAEKLSAKLQEVITKGVGSIRIDERTNKIAITDYPDKLRDIEAIIAAFDEKTPQVLIDAQIIEIKPSDLFEMGVNWDFWIKKYFDIKANLPIGTANRLIFGTSNSDPAHPGDFKAIMDVLRTIGDVKILSSPRIMSLNNQEAKIHVGVKDAYITSTTSQGASGTTVTSQAVNFVDTGIQLYVTPTINKHDFVTMKIKPEVSEATRVTILSEGQQTQIPIVSTSEAETTVTVKDGVTIIIGGLSKDKREKTVKKIPILADLPLVGHFFQSVSDNLTKTDLVILLTPHILSGESTFTEFSEVEPKEGAVVKMVKGELFKKKISGGSSGDKEGRYYYQSILNKVKSLTRANRPKGESGSVEVFFTLDSKGRLTHQPRVMYSSNQNLNDAVIECVKFASPFPAFPKEMKKEEENFRLTLEYK